MKKKGLIGLFVILVVLSSSTYNLWSTSAIIDRIQENSFGLNEDIDNSVTAPGIVNETQLGDFIYDTSLRSDRRFTWKITELERTENFHVLEGDKRLKIGDKILYILGGDPELQLTEPHDWAHVYVNDVMARYVDEDTHDRAIYKFIQPIGLDIIENFTSEYYNQSTFLNYYENNFNYTQNFETDYFGKVFNYTALGFFSYLELSPFVDRTRWEFDEEIAYYEATIVTQSANTTNLKLAYDRSTGFLNEMHYSSSFINGTGHAAGANFTLIRLHGWGLPYNITTWVVWIPILLVSVGLIVAVRLHAFQKLRLYLEARKLSKRD